jgi:glutathione S-transferase
MASIPVLIDDAADLTLPESTIIVEYLDTFGDAPKLVPTAPAAALQARLWDRIIDGHVMTPTTKIVGDSRRPDGRGDPVGVAEA